MDAPSTEKRGLAPAAAELLNSTQVLRITALGLLLIGCFVVLRPFLSAIMWAVILAFSSWPVYSRLGHWLRGKRTVAAGLMTLLIVVVMLAPFAVMGLSMAGSVKQLAAGAARLVEAGPPKAPGWLEHLPILGNRVAEAWRTLASDSATLLDHLKQYIEPATVWLLGASVAFAEGLAELALSILIAFSCFVTGLPWPSDWWRRRRTWPGPRGANSLTSQAKRCAGWCTGFSGRPLLRAFWRASAW